MDEAFLDEVDTCKAVVVRLLHLEHVDPVEVVHMDKQHQENGDREEDAHMPLDEMKLLDYKAQQAIEVPKRKPAGQAWCPYSASSELAGQRLGSISITTNGDKAKQLLASNRSNQITLSIVSSNKVMQ